VIFQRLSLARELNFEELPQANAGILHLISQKNKRRRQTVAGQFEERSMVILSEVVGSRSEAATKSRDPYTLTDT